MDSKEKIAEVLLSAGEIHHGVYKKVEGNDPDWALWYAHWLLTLSDLPELLPKMKTESELVYELVRLDREYIKLSPEEKWPLYYSEKLLENYS